MKKMVSTEPSISNIETITGLLADTPGSLERFGQHFSDQPLRQLFGTGGRSVIEILAHLLYGEAQSAEAIYLALLADEPILMDIHPERQLGKLLRYDLFAFSELLVYFKLRRAVLLRVLSSLTQEQWLSLTGLYFTRHGRPMLPGRAGRCLPHSRPVLTTHRRPLPGSVGHCLPKEVAP